MGSGVALHPLRRDAKRRERRSGGVVAERRTKGAATAVERDEDFRREADCTVGECKLSSQRKNLRHDKQLRVAPRHRPNPSRAIWKSSGSDFSILACDNVTVLCRLDSKGLPIPHACGGR